MPKKFKTVAITGASSGIGQIYAEELSRRGAEKVLLIARRTERLEKISDDLKSLNPQIKTECLAADLTSATDLRALCYRFESEDESFDLLVNNAGFGSIGRFASLDFERERQMLELNCLAPLRLTRSILGQMLGRGYGCIINVCSTAAYQPLPYMSTYGATKAFLYSFTLAVAEELRDSGVNLMAHCPGPTESEFHLNTGLKRKLDFVDGMEALPVVCQALDYALKGRRVCINGQSNRFLALVSKILPGTISSRIVASRLKNFERYT